MTAPVTLRALIQQLYLWSPHGGASELHVHGRYRTLVLTARAQDPHRRAATAAPAGSLSAGSKDGCQPQVRGQFARSSRAGSPPASARPTRAASFECSHSMTSSTLPALQPATGVDPSRRATAATVHCRYQSRRTQIQRLSSCLH